MRNRKVLYPWRVALYVLAIVGLLCIGAFIWVVLPMLLEIGARILALTIPLGVPLVFGLFGLAIDSLWEWAFERHWISQEHRDFVQAWAWANKTFPGPVKDPWVFK